jgi:hypothetical protein
MAGGRREQIAESVLVAAGVRRDRKVTARTQLGRLDPAAREAARDKLAAWWGGSYRGKDLTAAKTRRRRARYETQHAPAAPAPAVPPPQPPVAPGFADWLEGADTAPPPPAAGAPEPASPPAAGDFGAWLGGEDEPALEAVGESDVIGDRTANYDGPGERLGHFSGPGFDTPDELAGWMDEEELHWVAEMMWDGEAWHAWFPDRTP